MRKVIYGGACSLDGTRLAGAARQDALGPERTDDAAVCVREYHHAAARTIAGFLNHAGGGLSA